jgi:hypothetical protein
MEGMTRKSHHLGCRLGAIPLTCISRGGSLSFEFQCRETQGALLALTSSAKLEALATPSKKEMKRFLCSHGKQLMENLRQYDYLDPGESLYVVTGTIKSDSWGIAVHTSPMREPYDYVVLKQRPQGGGDAFVNTYEWTSCGKADARYGESTEIDGDGKREMDQCLFLRGFLMTPSQKMEGPSHVGGQEGRSAGDPCSGSDSPDNDDRGSGSRSKNGGSKDTGSEGRGYSPAENLQLCDAADLLRITQFPSPASKVSLTARVHSQLDYRYINPRPQDYYPSFRINEMLLRQVSADLLSVAPLFAYHVL